MVHPEYQLQRAVCKYLEAQYPKVLFLSDTVASVKLTAMQAVRNKAIQKKGFKTPDLIIFQPNFAYKGLMIELKVESPFKINGELKSSDHLKGQQESLEKLRELGYDARFSWGFEMTKLIIDNYLKNQ